ncbi:hypothetical protein AMECASPLE_036877 [Ameca splendens]|uniref:Uncharacterized protein n=1 Tax=Ameca splendens TaxID=208324 RepID=A0ABV1A352_9TELE
MFLKQISAALKCSLKTSEETLPWGLSAASHQTHTQCCIQCVWQHMKPAFTEFLLNAADSMKDKHRNPTSSILQTDRNAVMMMMDGGRRIDGEMKKEFNKDERRAAGWM